MRLSSEMISEFVKVTNDTPKQKSENTLYGTIKPHNGKLYVQIDGSDQLTPFTSTVNYFDGQRVMVVLKDHTATVTGNISTPSVIGKDIENINEKVAKFDSVVSDNVTINGRLDVNEATMVDLQAETVAVSGKVIAAEGAIEKLKTDKLDVDTANAEFVVIGSRLDAADANITKLDTKKLDAESAELMYANIDFTNISKAAMEYFYATSGLIDNVIVGDGTITGVLVGVTISGDLIEGNTVVADKLVIKGEDGLYYKLNTDGVATSSEQTEYNSLNGQVITSKSITAEKVNVNDLVAFDATIGGFTITDDSIQSYVKDSDGNTTRGIYLGADGQINFGDDSNFIKYYRDDTGAYRLAISAESITYALNGKQHSIADLGMLGDYINIGTYENEPCILLGESDSDFKLVITNTRIVFMEGSDMPTYIKNKSLYTKKAVVEEELQQGSFAWTVRQNGNMGLVWKGVV